MPCSHRRKRVEQARSAGRMAKDVGIGVELGDGFAALDGKAADGASGFEQGVRRRARIRMLGRGGGHIAYSLVWPSARLRCADGMMNIHEYTHAPDSARGRTRQGRSFQSGPRPNGSMLRRQCVACVKQRAPAARATWHYRRARSGWLKRARDLQNTCAILRNLELW